MQQGERNHYMRDDALHAQGHGEAVPRAGRRGRRGDPPGQGGRGRGGQDGRRHEGNGLRARHGAVLLTTVGDGRRRPPSSPQDPVLVDASGKGDIFPTVFALWRRPQTLPHVFVKHPSVTQVRWQREHPASRVPGSLSLMDISR